MAEHYLHSLVGQDDGRFSVIIHKRHSAGHGRDGDVMGYAVFRKVEDSEIVYSLRATEHGDAAARYHSHQIHREI